MTFLFLADIYDIRLDAAGDMLGLLQVCSYMYVCMGMYVLEHIYIYTYMVYIHSICAVWLDAAGHLSGVLQILSCTYCTRTHTCAYIHTTR